MNTSLTAAVAAERVADLRRDAQAHRLARKAAPRPAPAARRRRIRPRFGWLPVRRPSAPDRRPLKLA